MKSVWSEPFYFFKISIHTLETVTQCPVCGNDQFSPYITCVDYLVSQQKFSIQQCQRCTFRLTNPQPDKDSMGAYYKSDQYVSHKDSGGGLINTAYRLVRNYTLRTKLNLVNQLNGGPGRLLDVGCGTGEFLKTCQQGGWQVKGMEPDNEARDLAAGKLNIAIEPSLDALVGSQVIDVITLWHVLEHVSNLNKAIPQLRKVLTGKGILLIAVPNSNAYDAKVFGEYWAAYDVPRHLHHFTPATIEALFNKHGFVLIGKRPMLFDAFYISLLSTRYQTGKTDYIRSVQTGLASNRHARKTGDYSSLIYLFKPSN